MATPAVVWVGCWPNASVVAGPATIVNTLLAMEVSPGLDAVRFLFPMRLMLRSSNVARPSLLVERLRVPLSVPVPDDSAIVTVIPATGTILSSESRTCTVIAGARVAPAAAVVGCWRKTSLFAGRGVMVKELLIAAVNVPPVALSVFSPERLILRLLNVAMPEVVVFVSVPERTPVPELNATVTDVPVVLTGLP